MTFNKYIFVKIQSKMNASEHSNMNAIEFAIILSDTK